MKPIFPIRHIATIILTVLLTCTVVDTIAGCALFTRENAKTALDVAQVTCIIAQAASSDEAVAKACGIANEFLPDLRRILSEQRASARRIAAQQACSSFDGGALFTFDGVTYADAGAR